MPDFSTPITDVGGQQTVFNSEFDEAIRNAVMQGALVMNNTGTGTASHIIATVDNTIKDGATVILRIEENNPGNLTATLNGETFSVRTITGEEIDPNGVRSGMIILALVDRSKGWLQMFLPQDASASEVAAELAATEAGEIEDRLQIQFDQVLDALNYIKPTLVIILQVGQSLDRERSTGGRITNDPPPGGLAPNGGYETGQQASFINNAFVQPPQEFETLVPFVQREGFEGWGGGSIIVHMQDSFNKAVLFYANAIGGYDFEQTGPGSGPYGTGLEVLQLGYDYAVRNGFDVQVRIRQSQGEADADTTAAGGGSSEAAVTQAQWEQALDELKTWGRDWNIISNGTMRPPTIVVSPMNSGGHFGAGGRAVQAAQLAAAKAGKIILAPALYQFFSTVQLEYWENDQLHKAAKTTRLHAELVSLVERRISLGIPFVPLHVLSASRTGAVITLNLSKDAEVDTVDVTEPTLYPNGKRGIHVYQSDGTTEVVVSTAVLTDARTITVTCASDPGANCLVRIAQQPYPGGNQIPGWMERANFRALETLGQSIYDDGNGPRTFYDYIMNQEVEVA